jgi:hypothetical protein
MAEDPNKRSGADWEKRFQEAGARAEEDLKALIAYLNDEVVPDVRKHGSVALRKAAEQMERLAQRMDDRPKPGSAKGEEK